MALPIPEIAPVTSAILSWSIITSFIAVLSPELRFTLPLLFHSKYNYVIIEIIQKQKRDHSCSQYASANCKDQCSCCITALFQTVKQVCKFTRVHTRQHRNFLHHLGCRADQNTKHRHF